MRLNSTIARGLDLLIALVLSLAALPLIAVAALGVLVSTREIPFYRHSRVGLAGRKFSVVKVKTMRSDSTENPFTTANDPRVTRVGAWLRRAKIDELPQLFQVLAGSMSIVGPRPDIRAVVDQIPEPDRSAVLSVRPGVTGIATLAFRDEEALLAHVDEPEVFSIDVLLPAKTALNLAYQQHGTFADYFTIIWRTVSKSETDYLESLVVKWDPDLLGWLSPEPVREIRGRYES